MSARPLAIDLFCGLGGWTEGFLAEGYDVVGFDIERHQYGDQKYPAQLVLQDVLTLQGSQFRDAAVIVASPPCQAYSYRAMPWKRAKALPPPSNELFEACFRIQREAIQATGQYRTCRECEGEAITAGCCRCEGCDGKGATWYPAVRCEECDGVGVYQRRVANSDVVDETCLYCEGIGYTNTRYIPLVIENVKGAQPWVGRARWHYGSFYLWGDVPALMPFGGHRKGSKGIAGGSAPDGTGNSSWFFGKRADPRDVRKSPDGNWQLADGTKMGGGWWHDSTNNLLRKCSSRSSARKAASAQIAKIPLPLSQWIARCYAPLANESAGLRSQRR